MLVDDGRVRGLRLHMERLDRDSRTLFGEGIEPERIREYVRHAVTTAQKPIVVRVTAFCRNFDLAHPTQAGQPDILVTTRPVPVTPLPPVSLEPMFYQRELPEVKTTNVNGSLHRRRLAQTDGFDDSLFINEANEIAEGPTWSIGFMQTDHVILPDALSLPSVSIALLKEALQAEGMPVQVRAVRLQEVSRMDMAFTINAVSGIRPVAAIGQHAFSENAKLNVLQELYEKVPYEQL